MTGQVADDRAMSVPDFLVWGLRTPDMVVSATQVARLVEAAVRRTAGEAGLPSE
ncbi:hypothetical protein [Streptomyces sp. AcE210]|uniref:hypothetical protein n=1 Tax=Streptomyces sp. AcE210 TaxID=2292703 RepID=UPI001404631A|nr:hypothetical protein [Streptomyces sp. AcE210]